MLRWYRRLFVAEWERINQRAAQGRSPGFDGRVALVLVLVALVMIFQEYYGDRPFFFAVLGPRWEGSRYYLLISFAWWAGAKVVGYLVIPALTVRWLLRGRLRDYGFSSAGLSRHVWIYVALYLAILPAVLWAAQTKPFLNTYPYYKYAARSWTDFFAWELMYGATFLALEFFYRGFLLFALERQLGAYAIFVMVVPYCMIHFHKPVAEVCGAIVAGIVLGTLSMVTRSIWCGVFIHVSVAWTMDLLAMWHTTGMPWSTRMGEFAALLR